MGMRANYVLVEGTRHRVAYNHWRAERVPFDVFWGPEYATLFVRAQRESEWLDDVWCEGGFLVDLDRRQVLWFSGGDIGYDADAKRAFASLMSVTWPGWSIRYAHDGLADLVRHVGEDPSVVRTETDAGDLMQVLAEPQRTDWIDIVCSIRTGDGRLLIIPAAAMVSTAFLLGPRLLDHAHQPQQLLDERCAAERGSSKVRVTVVRRAGDGWDEVGDAREHGVQPPNEFRAARPVDRLFLDRAPSAGIHVDETVMEVHAWSAEFLPGIADEIPALWPEWTFEFHADDYQDQVRRCDERLQYGTRPDTELVEEIAAMLRSAEPVDQLVTVDRETSDLENRPVADYVGEHPVGDDFLRLADGSSLPLDAAQREAVIERALRIIGR